MTRIVSFCVTCLFLLTLLSWSFAQVRQQTATVRISSLIWNGKEFGTVHVKSFKSEQGAEIRDRFRNNIATRVPFGIYDMVVDKPGFPIRRRVDVVESNVWVVVSPDIGDGDTNGYAPNFTVRGTVRNVSPSDDPVFLRLVGVYTDYVGDTKLQISGTQGTFTLSGMEPDGRYVLITTGRSGVLDTRSVDILNGPVAPIEIDLAKRSAGPSGNVR